MVVPILVNISRWRIGRDDDMGILIVASVAGLKSALDIGSRTSMLACMGKSHTTAAHLTDASSLLIHLNEVMLIGLVRVVLPAHFGNKNNSIFKHIQ